MDTARSAPPNLAARLRLAKVDERVAALLAAAIIEELGPDILGDSDEAAMRRLTNLVQVAARQAGTSAVNRFVFELLALLDEQPDLRAKLAQRHPEFGFH
jgi:hypothetical protein